MMIMLSILMASTPVPLDLALAWAEFSRVPLGTAAPSLRSVRTKVEVGTLGYDRGQRQLDFWLRRTVVTRGVVPTEEVTWADTRTCPAARPTLASMRNIPVPKFAPIGSTEGRPIVMDGVAYSLRTYSDQGKLTAETNVGTPLAAWIESALKAFDGCWGRSVPARAP